MKRALVFVLAVLLIGSALFADDAKVMPMMVGRLYLAPTFSMGTGEYDKDGEFTSFDDSIKVFNMGFALEYGIINWITAAVQWVPGWTIWSDISGASSAKGLLNGFGSKSDVHTNGVADLFAGLKIQVVGEKAPVKTKMFRFAMAPGAIIPLPGPDFEDEVANVMTSDKAALSRMDNHVLAAGIRSYFDWIINEHFFINLYNEVVFYPKKQDLNKDGPALQATKLKMAGNPALSAFAAQIMKIEGDVNYKYRLTFELEPVFTYPIIDGLSFTVGLPINYRYIPAYEYSLDGVPPAIPGVDFEATILGSLNTDPQHSLNINPNVSMFLTKTPLPLEFKFQYGIPVYGQNVMARHNMVLQIKAYFALPGRPQ